MDDGSWAVREFGGALLGAARRTARLVDLAATLGERPTASLPDGCGTAARLKAAYRFFANDAIDPTAMLASHVAATYDRLALVPLVLAVQDTTLLDDSHHPATTGLGPLDRGHQGLLAQLGGFHGRARAAVPGVTVLWRGFQHLADLTRMYQVFRPPPQDAFVGNP